MAYFLDRHLTMVSTVTLTKAPRLYITCGNRGKGNQSYVLRGLGYLTKINTPFKFGMAFTELQMPIDLPACFAAGVKRYFLMSNDATNSHWLCDLMPCCASLSPSPLRKLVLQLRHWQWLLDTALPGDFGQGSNPVELSNMSWLSQRLSCQI